MDQLNSSLARVKVGKVEPIVKDTTVDLRPEKVNDDQEIIEEETENTILEGTHFLLITCNSVAAVFKLCINIHR